MVDRVQLSRAIESAPDDRQAAVVSRAWLQEVARELAAGDAALAQLAAMRTGQESRA